MIRIRPEPDFRRFRETLLLEKAYRRPPLFDFHVDRGHKAKVVGRAVERPADEVEFFRRAGYDYVQCTVWVPSAELEEAIGRTKGEAASHGSDLAVIRDEAHWRGRRWSWMDAAEGDLRAVKGRLEWLEGLLEALPAEMKIVLHGADVFTMAWEMMGFDTFCFRSIEEPGFVKAVMESLAGAQLNAMRAAVELAGERIGAVFYSDDIAYTEGLLLSPAFFRQFLFPTIGEVAALGARVGAPLIYHSDGRLYDVLEDLHAAGVRGIQPLEPKSMDPGEIQRRWPGKFCLIGNIDLDLMSRGTEEAVEAQVRDRIERIGPGGYMPGVSNTVPEYVRFENYRRMIETVYSYG